MPFCQSIESADCSLLRVRREGFSLLFYGFGSKKALLESFARECLTDGGAVVFNGYMQSLNIREILLKVASLLRVPRYEPIVTCAACSRHGDDVMFVDACLLEQPATSLTQYNSLAILTHNNRERTLSWLNDVLYPA